MHDNTIIMRIVMLSDPEASEEKLIEGYRDWEEAKLILTD